VNLAKKKIRLLKDMGFHKLKMIRFIMEDLKSITLCLIGCLILIILIQIMIKVNYLLEKKADKKNAG